MNITRDEWHLIKLRYGCYLIILDSDTLSSKIEILLKKDNFSFYYSISCTVLALLNIGSNSLLIYGLLKARQKLTLAQKMFVYLSCTDLISGFVVMPMLIYYRIYGSSCLCMALMMAIFSYVVISDFFILLTISVLRLSTIRSPLTCHSHLKVAKLMVFFQIAFSLLIATGFFSLYYYAKGVFAFKLVGYVANASCVSICVAVLTCVSMSLFTLQKYKRANSFIFTQEQLLNHRKSAFSLLVIGLMMALFILVQVPMFWILHLKLKDEGLLSGESFKATQNFVDIELLISQMNTITNSMVIIGRSKVLRKRLFNICRYT